MNVYEVRHAGKSVELPASVAMEAHHLGGKVFGVRPWDVSVKLVQIDAHSCEPSCAPLWLRAVRYFGR